MLYQLSYVRTSTGPTRSYLRRVPAPAQTRTAFSVRGHGRQGRGVRSARVGRSAGASGREGRGPRSRSALAPHGRGAPVQSDRRRVRAIGSGGRWGPDAAGPEGRLVGSDAAPTDRDAGHIQKWREHPSGACKLLQVRSRERASPQGDWRSGSALPSHGRGHWFDPSIAHGRILGSLSCGRSSVGRASPCQGEGRRFESGRPLRGNGAPDLASGALFRMMREHHPVGWPRGEATACKAVYTGSNPVPTSNGTRRCRPGRLAQR